MKKIAQKFGISLDNDEFEITKETLSQNCKYIIGEEILLGPDAICNSYQQNMIAGRKKLDKLEWGKSRVQAINESEFYVHFTDYLTHKGINYTHRCKQKLTIQDGSIILIEHIPDEKEKKKLDEFYRNIGL